MSALGLENLEKIAIDHVKAERQELLEEGIDTLKSLMKKKLGLVICIFYTTYVNILHKSEHACITYAA